MSRGLKMLQRLAGMLLAAQFVGCGLSDGLTRVVANGSVRLNGTPVERGQIRFIPDEMTKGPVTIQEIRGGKYSCERSGGVPVGNHRVEILAWDPSVPFPTGPGQATPPQLAPKKYNVDSQLVVILDDSTNPVVKDFDL